MIVILLSLLLFQLLQPAAYLLPEAEFDGWLPVGVAEGELMDLLLVFLLAEEVGFPEVGSDDEAENVDLFCLVVVAH